MTHSELVEAARKWLAKKCSVVVTELATIGEEPDALGWQGTYSTLIECKASRADFAADASKAFRREAWMGIGQHRYFMAVDGLIKPEELPPKWGLLEIVPCGVRVTVKSGHHEDVNSRHEIGILLSTLRRIGQSRPTGVSIRYYTIESKNRTTVGIADSPRPHNALNYE